MCKYQLDQANDGCERRSWRGHDATGARMNRPTVPPSGLLGPRAALVLLLAVLAAAAAGGLTWFSRRNTAEATLAGLACFAAATRFFDWLIT